MAAGLIRSVPSIMMGKPVVAGTRIPVESILEKLAAGETIERLLEAHPRSRAGVGVRSALSWRKERTDEVTRGCYGSTTRRVFHKQPITRDKLSSGIAREQRPQVVVPGVRCIAFDGGFTPHRIGDQAGK